MEGGGEKETGEEAAASDVNQEPPTRHLVEEGVAWFQEIRRISKEQVRIRGRGLGFTDVRG